MTDRINSALLARAQVAALLWPTPMNRARLARARVRHALSL